VGARPTDSLPLPPADVDPYGEDLQLALHLSYELSYRSSSGVDDALEWDLDLLRLRSRLERPFLDALRRDTSGSDDVEAALAPLLLEPVSGTGPSWHLAGRGEHWQLREYVAHRSVYHLKEADPQAFVVPRPGRADQGGAGVRAARRVRRRAGRADARHPVRLDDARAGPRRPLRRSRRPCTGRHARTGQPHVAAGLRRSLRGAAVGQFVMIEVTSSPGPAGCRRPSTGCPTARGQRFYDEHIEADAVHEQVLRAGLRDLLRREPQLAADVVLGIEAGLLLEDRFAEHVLAAWSTGASSLRRPLGD
jgi:hypothetical protein